MSATRQNGQGPLGISLRGGGRTGLGLFYRGPVDSTGVIGFVLLKVILLILIDLSALFLDAC